MPAASRIPFTYVLFALFSVVHQSNAQSDILSMDSYVMAHWGTKEGLPSSEVRPVLQTRDGYIWIGTGLGLARFDGVQFESFVPGTTPNIGASDVTALHEDRSGVLWIGFQSGGVQKYSDGHFTTPSSCAPIAFGTPSDIFSDSTGGIYICCVEGLFHVRGDSGSFVKALPEKPIHGFTTPGNDIYVVGDMIVRLSRDRPPTVVGALPQGGRINDLHPEDSSSFLAASTDGLLRFRTSPGGLLIPGERYELSDAFSILPDGDGQYLIGTLGRGIFRFDGHRVSRPHGLSRLRGASQRVYSLYRDGEDGIWAATSGGAFRLSRSFFKIFGEGAGLANDYVWNFRLTHDGTLWVGVGRAGIYRIKNGQTRLFLKKDGMPDNHITEIFESSDGSMWFGGANGRLVTMRNGSKTRLDRLPGYPGGRVLSIAEDSKKKIWIGTRNGLHTFEGDRFISHPIRHNGAEGSIRSITPQPNGDIWFVGSGTIRRLRNDTVTVFQEKSERALFSIFALLIDSSRVWYGTYGGGLYLIQGDSVISLRKLNNSFGPRIIAIHEDHSGHLWLNAEHELQRVHKADILAALDHPGQPVPVDVYDHLDGFENLEFDYSSLSSVQQLDDGRLLYASTSGIVVVDPEAAVRSTVPPPVTIEGIVADGESLDLRHGIEIPPGTRRLDIKYAALRFQTPGRVRFRFRLSGVDRDWVETAGLQRSITYTNPGNGEFDFALTASANGGSWNPHAASVKFTIAPYLYERWSFRIGGIVVAFILLVAGYNARVRAIRKRNRTLEEEITLRRKIETRLTDSLQEKTVMLREIHHRVKNNMQVISSLMSLQLGASSEPLIQEALKESQARIRSMALVHETLYRSENLAAVGFREYLETLIRQVHHANSRSNVSIQVDGADLRLPLDKAIPAGLLMNELVTNAIKHAFPKGAEGTIVVFSRLCEGDYVEVGVSDTGIGLPPDFDVTEGTSLGLRLVTTLAGQLGGKLSVQRGPGTTIAVQFPTRE